MHQRFLASILSTSLLISSSALFADTNTALQSYFQAWNEQQPEKRRKLLDQSVIEQFNYVDPQVSLNTRAALEKYIEQTQSQISGLRAEMTGDIKRNQQNALFNWRIYDGSGQLIAQGVDSVAFAKDGRLQRIDGFFDVQLK
jgi:hypothetical protein